MCTACGSTQTGGREDPDESIASTGITEQTGQGFWLKGPLALLAVAYLNFDSSTGVFSLISANLRVAIGLPAST
jgi:hypothetical protein